MLKNKRLLRFMAFAAGYLERPQFSIFHRSVRLFYLKFVVLFLNILCPRAQIRARHSLISKSKFNALYSDVDLDAYIISGDEAAIAQVRNFYLKAKRVLFFLGEIEIYTEVEKVIRDELLKNVGVVYRNLRLFRKVWWMQYAKQIAPSTYHRNKALRALKICLNEINPQLPEDEPNPVSIISEEVEKFMKELFSHRDFGLRFSAELAGRIIHCPYMGVKLKLGRDPNWKDGLNLNTEAALVLMALTPVSYTGQAEHELIIQNLRRQPEIFEIWSKLTTLEILIFQAFSRGFTEKELWMKRWQSTLFSAQEQVAVIKLKVQSQN